MQTDILKNIKNYTKDTDPGPFSKNNVFLYNLELDGIFYKGFTVEEINCNKAGIAHGGTLIAFADGIMGYTALGGLAAVLISVDPVQEAWSAGGFDILMCLWLIIALVLIIRFILKNFQKSKVRTYAIAVLIISGILLIRFTAEPGIEAIEDVNPAKTGFLGGFGLPIIFSWIVGAFFAGGLAFIVGKVALGLRADYLAIATLLISEIVIAIIKHEDWLAVGVKIVI